MFQILGIFLILIALKMVITNEENVIVNTIFVTLFNTTTNTTIATPAIA